MTVHTLTATATDTMAATALDTVTINSTAAAPPRVVRRSLLENRISWGSVVDQTPKGPTFNDAAFYGYPYYVEGTPITCGVTFVVHRACTLTGCRIYKAPNATGTDLPVKIWIQDTSVPGVVTGVELGSEVIPEWVVDDGGWRQVTFRTPVDLVDGTTYVMTYFAPDGIYSYTPWVWNGQNTCVWPFEVNGFGNGSAVGWGSPTTIFPLNRQYLNYYIDPQVEWPEPMPAFTGDTPTYFDQFTNYNPRHAFPVAVFYADAEYIEDYYSAGVNTLFNGGWYGGYPAAMESIDNAMDWWIGFDWTSPQTTLQSMAENPGMAESVVGYLLDDEPDQTAPYRSPSVHLQWRNAMRQRDSTRPFYCGYTRPVLVNQSFAWNPQGATPLQVNELWRQWIAIVDAIGADDYVWYYNNDAGGTQGVWTYAQQVRRLFEVSDNNKMVWVVIEVTSEVSNDVPTPENVRKGCWAGIIAGAQGIILFDHRFPNAFVDQDFAHMLHNTATDATTGRTMRQTISALSTLLQEMGPALQAKDLGLVTSWSSSNTTSGPLGGTYGVPLHYKTCTDGTYEYVIVQAIRPGSTTGTVTIPSWASEVVDVITEEPRTKTVSTGGVLTDSFTDYAVHIYRRRPSPSTPPTIATTSLPPMVAGTSVSVRLVVTGTTAPSTFAVTSGTLPAGLTLSTTGMLTGTPSTAGAYSFTVTATNANGSDPQAYSGTIAAGPTPPTITTTSLGTLRAEEAFSLTLSATGTTPITFTVTAGTLPAGLTLSAGGALTGTPTTSGAYSFTVRATNAGGYYPQAYSGTVAASLGIYSLFTPATTPTTYDPELTSVEVGFIFSTTVAGNITALRFYKQAGATGVHYGRLWRQDTTTLLASQAYTETASGWQELTLSTPVAITPGNTYYASVLCPNGMYAYTPNVFSTAHTVGPLYTALSTTSTLNGLYNYASTLASPAYPGPSSGSTTGTSFMVDVVFQST